MKIIDKIFPDNFVFGLIQGIIAPCIIISLILFFGTVEWSSNMFVSKAFINLFIKIVSICVLPNLGLFYLYINKNFYRGAMGVIVATFAFAVIVFAVKFIV